MSTLRRTVLLLSVSCLLGGCAKDFSPKDLFFVELEEKRVCKQLDDQVIPGAALGSLEVSKVVPFSLPTSEFQGEALGTLSLQFTETTLETDDNTRFDRIEEALLAIRPEGSTDLSRATTLLGYKRQAGTGGQPLRLQGEEVDLTQLAGDGPVELFLQAKGELPSEDWTLRARACWAFRVRVNYLHLLPFF